MLLALLTDKCLRWEGVAWQKGEDAEPLLIADSRTFLLLLLGSYDVLVTVSAAS